MILLGIAGAAGAGKDTVADYLVDKYNFVKFGFAWPLKAMLHAGLGLDPNDYQSGPQKEADIPRFGFSYRKAAQTLGTEWGRGLLRDDLWLLLAQLRIEWIKVELPKVGGIACCDLRFENEASLIRGQGGLVLHLKSNRSSVTLGEEAKHISESGITFRPGDAFINNSHSILQLYNMVDWMMKDLPKAVSA
jgi:hypothetical protein